MKTKSLAPLFAVAYSIFAPNSEAQDFSKVYAKYADTVVKITVRYQSIDVSFGSGFFVNAKGDLITNRHVISSAFIPGYSVQVTDKSGKTNSNVRFVGCSETGADLCLLNVDMKPKTWVNLSDVAANSMIGSRVIAIGHPKGLEWTISDGLISSMRKWPLPKGGMVDMVQISNPISPGNSGGPLLNENGGLVGVVTAGIFSQESQNLNFAIASAPTLAFAGKMKAKKSVSFSDMNKESMKIEKAAAMDIFDRALKPIIASFEKGKIPKTGVRRHTLYSSQSKYKYEFHLPDAKGGLECQSNAQGVSCAVPGVGFVVMTEARPDPSLLKESGKSPAPRPLDAIADLLKRNPNALAGIAPEKKKFLFSQPKTIECKRLKSNFSSDYDRCSLFTYNVKSPDHSTVQKSLQFFKGDPVIEILAVSTSSMSSIIPFAIADMMEMSLTRVVN